MDLVKAKPCDFGDFGGRAEDLEGAVSCTRQGNTSNRTHL
jgi:hypothetical protein